MAEKTSLLGGEDLTRNDIIVLVAPKKEIRDMLVEVNKITGANPDISFIVLNKATLDDMSFTRYVHNVISQVRVARLKGLLLCAKEDLNEQIREDLEMFADLIKEVG